MAEPWQPEAADYEAIWSELTRSELRQSRIDPDQVSARQLGPVYTRAFRRYLLACYCQSLREKWATPWEPLEEFAPAWLELVQRHRWPLGVVKEYSEEDLAFLLHVELADFTLPAAAHRACRFNMELSDLTHVLAPHVKNPE